MLSPFIKLVHLYVCRLQATGGGTYVNTMNFPPLASDPLLLDLETVTFEQWRLLIYNKVVHQKNVILGHIECFNIFERLLIKMFTDFYRRFQIQNNQRHWWMHEKYSARHNITMYIQRPYEPNKWVSYILLY